MKPAQTRDVSKLRREIIGEILQHPLTLVPAVGSFLSLVWTVAFNPSVPSVIGIFAGGALSLIGALYGLLFNGVAIRDRILARWERQADEEENLTKMTLRREFQITAGAADLLALYDEFDATADEVRKTLAEDNVSEVHKAHFEPVVEQNCETAITIFNRLAYLQKRLSNLLATGAGASATAYNVKLDEMRSQRMKMIAHIRELLGVFDKLLRELPKFGDTEFDLAQRDLEELDRTIELTRTAYQRLKAETQPISGIHAVPKDVRNLE